jgi:hypothetical protein
MHIKSFLRIALVLSILPIAASRASGPLKSSKLSEPVKLADGKGFVDADTGHSDPCVTDWNNDDKKDLLVGQFGGGKVRIYINRGTDAAPEFDGFEFLKAGKTEASVPSG